MSEFRPPISPLFVPADRPDRFAKAAASGADAIFVDLEDAVAPADKERARANLEVVRSFAAPVFIRINPEGTEWHGGDVEALRAFGLRNVLLPKVEDAGAIDAVITEVGGQATVIATVETARGVANAREIARHGNVRQLAFGTADYALDLGIVPSEEALSFALSLLVIASRAEGLPGPLDGPTFDLADGGLLAADVERARRLGASGKLCIHPKQVETVRRGLAPSRAEIDWALKVMEAEGIAGAVRAGNELVDRPIVERARLILQRAGRG
jgi:citrate lyase subunit beta/citryl-CoA lyase